MSHRSLPFLFILVLLVAPACAAPPPEGVPSTEAIVGGHVDTGDPAVVYVQGLGGFFSCSGTLISDHVVLTAKHCVQGSGMATTYGPSTFRVGIGTSFGFGGGGGTPNLRVSRVYTTPGVWTDMGGTGFSGAIVGIDIGLLVLTTHPDGVTPIPIRRDPPNDMIGMPYTAIGFGETPTGGAGTKYVVSSHVEALDSGDLYSSMTICSGDSGGPMLQEMPFRRVVGVASFGEAMACPGRSDAHNRLDLELDLIDRAVIEAGDCANTGTEVCDSLDNNCDGTVDEGCTPLGSSCTTDSECAFAQLPAFLTPLASPSQCLDTGHGPICTRACDPVHGATDQCATIAHPYHPGETTAWDGASCVTTGSCMGVCAIAVRGALGNGAVCAMDTDCASLHCTDPGDGSRRCLTPCTGDGAGCPLAEGCSGGTGSCGNCVPIAELPPQHGYGEPCTTGADCTSGTCQSMGEPEPYCTRACTADTDCGPDFHCRTDMTCGHGAHGGVGQACVNNDDCQPGAFCATRAPDSWCTVGCAADTACPMHFACQPAAGPGSPMICVPQGALIGDGCTTDMDCVASICRGAVCTTDCATGARCAPGFYCVRDDAGLTASCLRAPPPPVMMVMPPKGGCCATAGTTGRTPLALFSLAVVGMIAASRRRGPRARRA